MVDGIMGKGEGGGENKERKDTGLFTYYVILRAINTHMAQYPPFTEERHVLGTRDNPQAPHSLL